jgi:hypothetical protein
MAFRLRIESLESRDNPSGPSLLDPTAPTTSGDAQPPATEPEPSAMVAGAQQVIENSINYLVNPLGYIS